MTKDLLSLLCCPVTKSPLTLQVITYGKKIYDNEEHEIITDAILFAHESWFYPVIDGIPRLLVESFIDHMDFLKKHLPDYSIKSQHLHNKYKDLLEQVTKKNRRTKKSFEYEWRLFNYDQDKTWNADKKEMMDRFFKETGEDTESLSSKLILDAGCGNGILDSMIAAHGATILGMDISKSIEKAFQNNTQPTALFIQADIHFLPVKKRYFDLVHCSGVLIHTPHTQTSFFSVESCVRNDGKLSVWLYHRRKDKIHNLILKIRRFTSKLPLSIQYYLYKIIFLPPFYLINLLKGKKFNTRELLIALMDQFSPEFRWEHEPEEVIKWFEEKNYTQIRVTTLELFGYNMTGIKKSEE
ncbi:MAG: methyltransferase domain-containing protein [Chitinophagaceae bacterium]